MNGKTEKVTCKNNVDFSLLYGSSLFMLGVAVFFMLSLLTLVILQTTNILTGLTTAERYGRSRPRPGPSIFDDLQGSQNEEDDSSPTGVGTFSHARDDISNHKVGRS